MSYNQNSSASSGATIVKIPDRNSSQQGQMQTAQQQTQLPGSGYNYMNTPTSASTNMQPQIQSQAQPQPQPQPAYNQQFHGQVQQTQGQTNYMQQQPQQRQTYGYPPQQQQQQQQRSNNGYSQQQSQPQTQGYGYAPQSQQQQQSQYHQNPMSNPYAPQTQNQPQPQQYNNYSQQGQQQMQMPQNNANMYMNNPYQQQQQSAQMPSKRKIMLKLVILGNSGVGKTSLMHRYHSNKFTGQYKATIGADYLSKQLTIPAESQSQPQKVTLTIWDTAGQERFQSLGKAFYRGSDACILVYDVTDRSSFDGLAKWKEEFNSCVSGSSASGSGIGRGNGMMNNRLQNGSPIGRNAPEVKFIVVANKADKVVNGAGSGKVVSPQEGKAYASSIGAEFFECSAKTALNVEQAFVAAAKSGVEYNNRKQMTASMMNGAGHAGMKGYVPPQRSVDLNRGRSNSGNVFENGDCC